MDHNLKDADDSHRLWNASQKITNDPDRPAHQDRVKLSEQDTSRSGISCSIDVHDKESIMNLFEDKLDLKVANIAMTLSMSSVTGLADLAEDEIIPKPIPMQVGIVRNILSRM